MRCLSAALLLLISPAMHAALPLDDATLFYSESFVGEVGHPLTAEVGSGDTLDSSTAGGSVAFTGVAEMSAQSSLAFTAFESAAIFFSLGTPLPLVTEFDLVGSFERFSPSIVDLGSVNSSTSIVSFTEPQVGVFETAVLATAALQSGTIFGPDPNTPSDPDDLVLTVVEQAANGVPLGFANIPLDAAQSQAVLAGAAYRIQIQIEFIGNTIRAGLEVDGFAPLLTSPLALVELGPGLGSPADQIGGFSAAVSATNRFPDPLGGDDSIAADLTRMEVRAEPLIDSDADGVFDPFDNCVDVPNAGQEDINAAEDDDTSLPGVQHYGDACDADLNEDGTVAASDFFAVFRPCLGAMVAATPACAEADFNGDGVVAASDFFSGLRPNLGTAPGPGLTE